MADARRDGFAIPSTARVHPHHTIQGGIGMRAGKLLSTIVWTFMALLVAFSISGCATKKPVVQNPSRPTEAPPTSTGPAPALTLSVSPSTIEKGQSATLTWDAKNAQS